MSAVTQTVDDLRRELRELDALRAAEIAEKQRIESEIAGITRRMTKPRGMLSGPDMLDLTEKRAKKKGALHEVANRVADLKTRRTELLAAIEEAMATERADPETGRKHRISIRDGLKAMRRKYQGLAGDPTRLEAVRLMAEDVVREVENMIAAEWVKE